MHDTLDLEAVAECRQVLDLAFAHAFPPCTNTFDCDTCPYAATFA